VQNKNVFTPQITSNILNTGRAIAEAYRGKTRREELLDNIIRLFENN